MLKILRLRIVRLLPSQLLLETVSQPNIEEDYMISIQGIGHTRLKQVCAFMISMHECPRVVVDLTVENLVDTVTDFSFWNALKAFSVESTTSIRFSRWTHNDALISTTYIVPAFLLLFSKNETD